MPRREFTSARQCPHLQAGQGVSPNTLLPRSQFQCQVRKNERTSWPKPGQGRTSPRLVCGSPQPTQACSREKVFNLMMNIQPPCSNTGQGCPALGILLPPGNLLGTIYTRHRSGPGTFSLLLLQTDIPDILPTPLACSCIHEAQFHLMSEQSTAAASVES